jgi:hypothetical protein
MSFKTSIFKTAIKCTPNKMMMWVANSKLKGIAEITDLSFDLESRKAFVQAYLVGEAEPIEVSVDGFAIVSNAESNSFIIQQGQSNRPWLNNLLVRIVGIEWKIPAIPQIQPYIGLITELLKPESTEQEDGFEQQEDEPNDTAE